MLKKIFFNDKPVQIDTEGGKYGIKDKIKEQELLGMHEYAEALAEFIHDCETPMTIGIQGDWGIGKTSTLNMIKALVQSRKNTKNGVVWFNTWQYSLFNQDDYLGAAVINALLGAIKKQFDIDDPLMERTKRMAGTLMKGLASLSLGRVSFDPTKMSEESSMEESIGDGNISEIMLSFKEDFQKLIALVIEKEQLNRMVIFIDDLDRVKPVKALELLESIKNFLDVEHCVFVLAVDYEVVQVGMAEKLGHDIQKTSGKSFFDKIIQLPFNMPVTSYRLGLYIKELLSASEFLGNRKIENISDEEVKFYTEITSCTVGRNPRSIKRVINYAKLLDIVRKKNATKDNQVKKEDRQILYSLLCMQIAWPEIFNYFVLVPYPETISNLEDWDFLDTVPHIQKLYDRTPDIEQLKNNISTYFDLLFEIVDVDNDGTIDKEEFEPIWQILKQVKLTSLDTHKQPFDELLEKVEGNDKGKKYEEFMKLFAETKWKTGKEISYKTSGARYFTIVMNRRQLGSIVSLKKEPLTFRLKIDDEKLRNQFEGDIPEGIDLNEVFVPLGNKKLTGFGDTCFDITKLQGLRNRDITRFLNLTYNILSKN